jgi:hypothetical protein
MTLSMLVLVAGCRAGGGGGGGTVGPAPAVPPPIGSAIYVSDSLADLQAGNFVTALNIYDLPEMGVRVIMPSIPSPTILHLEFYSPGGTLIYSDSSAWSLDASNTTMPMTNPPMNVQLATTSGGLTQMDRGIPVTGTSFSRYFQAGDWKVQATLDGVQGIISTPLSMTLSH